MNEKDLMKVIKQVLNQKIIYLKKETNQSGDVSVTNYLHY